MHFKKENWWLWTKRDQDLNLKLPLFKEGTKVDTSLHVCSYGCCVCMYVMPRYVMRVEIMETPTQPRSWHIFQGWELSAGHLLRHTLSSELRIYEETKTFSPQAHKWINGPPRSEQRLKVKVEAWSVCSEHTSNFNFHLTFELNELPRLHPSQATRKPHML